FRLAAAVVTSSKTELLGASGLIIRFSGQPVRVILRHSLNYRVALAGLERKPGGPLLCPVEDETLLKPITSTEDQALRRGDIPRFMAVTDSAAWNLDAGLTIPKCFARPSYKALLARIRGLEAVVVEEQLRLLAAALDFWNLRDLMIPIESQAGAIL